ncbi:hypothetical protein Pst134EA_004895 [Puccinia striiformis f. sp. tritici]|uniref:hypothetical protein n=1 Tax=Puccinia striiformis f. sp. tritici TaxID=168172 RepID=UPI002008CAEF|nr:hypothetical protein Pst134EA_004895 [Puccinia striiformis f. sp. tritici]KAH9470985.1 hypothetical protein Pst134EA_004895 [Puccinia striiformis f. sp. tritici]
MQENFRRPTLVELEAARTVVEPFHLFKWGKVVVTDNEDRGAIIAVIEFTPISDLSPQEKTDINTLNRSVHDTLMRSSRKPSKILGGMFRNLASVAFEDNQEIMRRHSIPGFASLDYDDPDLPDDCAPHVTFTSGGFYNKPHADDQDVPNRAH